MAWTDTCKIEACIQIDKRKEKLPAGVKGAMRDLKNELCQDLLLVCFSEDGVMSPQFPQL